MMSAVDLRITNPQQFTQGAIVRAWKGISRSNDSRSGMLRETENPTDETNEF
jgi:hypothetical protein